MTKHECYIDTTKHIETVRRYLYFFGKKLIERGFEHDHTKLESPELEEFTKISSSTPLKDLTYGSPEYEQSRKFLDNALRHHYAHNRHHPEHFDKGINDMNLIDIVEMLCDWKASSLRQHDGNILKSIETNAKRFGYDDQLKQIFINTAKFIDELTIE